MWISITLIFANVFFVGKSESCDVLAGTGENGFKDGANEDAMFSLPWGIVKWNDTIVVAEHWNHCLRKISGGYTETLAGVCTKGGDIDGFDAAAFFYPMHMTVDKSTGNLLIADYGNNKVKSLSPSGEVTSLFDVPLPMGVAADEHHVYVASFYHRIYDCVKALGICRVIAGTEWGRNDGAAPDATFSHLQDIALDEDENTIYVADFWNSKVRKLKDGIVSTIADVRQPRAILLTETGFLLAIDGDQLIKKIEGDAISTILVLETLAFGFFVDGTTLYITNYANQVLVCDVSSMSIPVATPSLYPTTYPVFMPSMSPLSPTNQPTTTWSSSTQSARCDILAGTGVKGFQDGHNGAAMFSYPYGIVEWNDSIIVAEYDNHCLRKISGRYTETVAGVCNQGGDWDGFGGAARLFYPLKLQVDQSTGALLISDWGNGKVKSLSLSGEVTTLFRVPSPTDIVSDAHHVYVASWFHRIYDCVKASGICNVLVGGEGGNEDGPAVHASFQRPNGIVLDAEGNGLYINDYGNNAVRKFKDDVVSTVTGMEVASDWQFSAAGPLIYTYENLIRAYDGRSSSTILTLDNDARGLFIDGATVYVTSATTEVLVCYVPSIGPRTLIADYQARSDVKEQSQIDLDVCDIINLLPDPNGEMLQNCTSCSWDSVYHEQIMEAWSIWENGQNTAKLTENRTIGIFSSAAETKESGNGVDTDVAYRDNPYISVMNEYWNRQDLNRYTWGYEIINATFNGEDIAGVIDMGAVGDDFRREVVKKGIVYFNIFPYVIWKLQDAINSCNTGDIIMMENSVHAWDEAVALYTGSLEGVLQGGKNGLSSSPSDCGLQFMLAEKRCMNFGTCTADYDYNPYEGYSEVNHDIFELFASGRDQILGSVHTRQCFNTADTMNEISALMLVPFIQGVQQYLYNTKTQVTAGEAGQLFSYATVVLPFIDLVDADAADMLFDRAWNLDYTTYDWKEIKYAIEATYPELGLGKGKGLVTCVQVGELLEGGDVQSEACTDPFDSSKPRGSTIETWAIVLIVVLSVLLFLICLDVFYDKMMKKRKKIPIATSMI